MLKILTLEFSRCHYAEISPLEIAFIEHFLGNKLLDDKEICNLTWQDVYRRTSFRPSIDVAKYVLSSLENDRDIYPRFRVHLRKILGVDLKKTTEKFRKLIKKSKKSR